MIFLRRCSILYDRHVTVKHCKQQLWKLKLKTKFNYMSFTRSLWGISSAVLVSVYYSPHSCLWAYRVCVTWQWVTISQWCLLYFLKPVISVLYIYTDLLSCMFYTDCAEECRDMSTSWSNHLSSFPSSSKEATKEDIKIYFITNKW